MVHQSEGPAAGLNLLNDDSSSGDLPNRDWQSHASAPPQHPSWWATIIALALLIVMAVLAGGAARRESAVIDEVAHIGAGLSYVQKLDLRLNPEHPPLLKVLSGISLALHGAKADYAHVSWKISDKFFSAYIGQWVFGQWVLGNWNNAASVLWWARLPMLGLTLLFGWVIFRLGVRLGGNWGGLLALVAYVTMPMLLVFGPLVLTDVGVTLFAVLTLWSMGEMWRDPSRKNIGIFALCFAGALLCKFSALVIFVILPIFGWSLRWRGVPGMPTEPSALKAWRKLRARSAWRGIFWALCIVYVFYFCFSIRQPTNALYFLGGNIVALFFRRLLLPFAIFFRGLFWVIITGTRPTFILGHHYTHGVWFYFPVDFILKSVPGFLLLLLLAFCLWAWKKKAKRASIVPADLAFRWRALWVGFWTFTAVCLVSRLTISIRHFSFSIALLALFLAVFPRMIASLRSSLLATGLKAATAILAISCLYTAVHAYPYYFPYINALGFGHPAYELLSDSNVDWNQALPQAEAWVQQRGIQQIGIDEYGFSDPAITVPQAHLWDCQQPAPDDAGRWEIVSADMILDSHNCGWILKYEREPIARGSMYAVHLPDPIPPAGSAGGPPLPKDTYDFLGFSPDIRYLFISMSQHPDELINAAATFQVQYDNAKAKKKAQSAGR